MSKKLARPNTKSQPAVVGAGTRAVLPFGAFGHPAGLMLEIGPGPEKGVVVVRVGGRLDYVFRDGEPYGCAVQDPPLPLYKPPEPSPLERLVLPNRPRLQA